MRASVLLQGALLTRFSEANLPLPAGDAVGLRSLDFHLSGLRAMGASVTRDAGLIRASAPRGLKGAEILLPQPSVGTTENLLLAAVLGGRNSCSLGEFNLVHDFAASKTGGDVAFCSVPTLGTRIGAGADRATRFPACSDKREPIRPYAAAFRRKSPCLA